MASAGGGTVSTSPKYGAIELKEIYQRNYWRGLAIACAILIVGFGGPWLYDKYFADDEPPPITVRIMKYSDLGPPPSINNANIPPPVSVSAPVAKPTVGAPVPVPDAEASPEQTLATQTEMSQVAAPIGEGTGEGGVQVQQDIKIEDDGPPADFVAVEKEPVVVRKVEPKYPELAMRAGLEGKVWVKIWVDKEGKPKQVVVIKSDAEIFNQAAEDAAKQFLFTPAYMNNGPVSVWVSVPFRFKLADRK